MLAEVKKVITNKQNDAKSSTVFSSNLNMINLINNSLEIRVLSDLNFARMLLKE